MSSKKYASPLRLNILPSSLLSLFLWIMHFFALILLFILAIDFIWLFLIMIMIVVLAINLINRLALLKSSNAIVNLIWDANNDWILVQRDGVKFKAELSGQSYVNVLITILIFKSHIDADAPRKIPLSFSKKVILLKDNINANDFRRLRVRLKVGKPMD